MITFNEETNIRDCILSLKTICDDIVVVDSCSQDNTVEIAKSLGSTVLIQPFLGDGPSLGQDGVEVYELRRNNYIGDRLTHSAGQ